MISKRYGIFLCITHIKTSSHHWVSRDFPTISTYNIPCSWLEHWQKQLVKDREGRPETAVMAESYEQVIQGYLRMNEISSLNEWNIIIIESFWKLKYYTCNPHSTNVVSVNTSKMGCLMDLGLEIFKAHSRIGGETEPSTNWSAIALSLDHAGSSMVHW